MPKGVKKRGPKFRQNLKNRVRYAKQKEQRKKQSKSTEKSVKEAWDVKRTVGENMAAMGITADPNAVVPIKQSRRKIIDTVPLDDLQMEVITTKQPEEPQPTKKFRKKANPKAAQVVGILQTNAQLEEEKQKMEKATVRRHHLPDRDVELCIYFLEKYDDDYQAMARDPRNLFQHTPKQIKKLINIFKESPTYKAINR